MRVDMKVTAVVAVFNVPEALLEACLAGLRRQTLRASDFEVIVVDDGSTDEGMRAALDRFVDEFDNARLERHAVNRGLNEARRTGVALARGAYVVFVDGDDILTSDALEQLWIAASNADADIAVGSLVRWVPDDLGYNPLDITKFDVSEDRTSRLKATLSGANSWTMCARAYRRSLLDDAVFDLPSRLIHEDLVTSVRLAFAAERVVSISLPVYFYTVNRGSITNSTAEEHIDGVFFAFQDWLRLASEHHLSGELDEAIRSGAAKMIGAMVDRIVGDGERLDLARRTKLISDVSGRYCGLFPDVPQARTRQVELLRAVRRAPTPERLVQSYGDDLEQRAPASGPLTAPLGKRPSRTLQPTPLALATKDKIVFVCQVDYHLRAAAEFALELRKRGHACAVLDNSRFADGGRRQLPDREHLTFWRTNRYVIEAPPYDVDWLSSARLVVFFNDLHPSFRDALEFRRLLGLPTVSLVEGINDFLRVDFDRAVSLPYRRTDEVFLAGEHDRRFFADRATDVVGLPGLELLTENDAEFPDQPLAVLNVNFTYGSQEHARDLFVKGAVDGIERAGFELAITQHPMDRARLGGLPVSSKSQYQLIEEGTVFVSRFATGILEALASGKPAVYFNPHGEQVEKFGDPMGAFDVATNADELADALRRVQRDVEDGTDFRVKAGPFLAAHGGIGVDERSAVERLADAAVDASARGGHRQVAVAALLVERLGQATDVDLLGAGPLLGPFGRVHHAQLNEEEMIGRYFGDHRGLMVDVGANFGNSFDIYLGKRWDVHAFEPDPNNRKQLFEYWDGRPGLVVSELAVSNVAGQELPFYASDESTGISSLAAFTDGHEQVATVTTTTLDHYLAEQAIEHVDFLKVDIEGYDKFALDGFPWDRDRPEVVLAEFEDAKTVPLGYTAHDMATDMIERGYTVYMSIWHPIVRYGIGHDWQELRRYDPALALAPTWGNMIAFREPPDEHVLSDLVLTSVKFSARSTSFAPTVNAKPSVGRRPWYADGADRVRSASPTLYEFVRSARRRAVRLASRVRA